MPVKETLRYKYKAENISSPQTLGIINNLAEISLSGSVIFVNIYSFSIAYAGGISVFSEFCNFNRRQLTISNNGGSLNIDKSEVIHDIGNTTGSTGITWTDSIAGSELVFECDPAGITQSAYIDIEILIQ